MSDDRTSPKVAPVSTQPKGIGFGLFLFFAGCVLLAQRLGLLPQSADWFFPVVLIAWGASEIYQRLKNS